MNKTKCSFYLIISLFISLSASEVFSQTLKINEFMAANSKTIQDPDYNNYADWIELYNYGSDTINLKNYFITDDFSKPQKYQFTTDLFIAPGSYFIVWADDKGIANHANFKLSASGEMIGLYNPSVQVVDSISFGAQQDDISYGLYPNGSTSWYYFSPSSPDTANPLENIYNKLTIPSLSSKSGFFNSPINISITNPDSIAAIRYTLDGSTPTKNSLLYSVPLEIDSTTVIKAKAFREGFLESGTISATYFINESTQLPVFSISTNPENLFSDTSGIYVAGTNGVTGNCSDTPKNWNQDWERPVDIQFFEKDRTLGFDVSAGVQIFGGCSRIYPAKSLAFYFRGNYGFSKLEYKLFPNLNIDEYNNFILRTSSQDWWRTMFRDGMVHTLISQNTNMAVQSYRPAVLFINGQYWGIHNIREKYNEHYLNSHYGVNEDSVDIVEFSKGITADNGDVVAYNNMINFLSSHDMSISANYDYIKSIADIDDYINYMCCEIFAANADWPGSNTKLWRERKPTGKFRWMIYDTDFTFGGNSKGVWNFNTLDLATASDGPSYPNPPWSTLMIRKLLENSEFKYEFIQRFAAHINTTFWPSHVINVIDSLSSQIANEIPRQKARWTQSITMGNDWNVNVQVMRDFILKRPDFIRSCFVTKFGLPGTYALRISRNNTDWGKVFSNSLEIKNNDSLNIFFSNVPVKLKAVPNEGYHFVHWEGKATSTSPEIQVITSIASEIKAVFAEDGSGVEDETHPASLTLYQNYPNPFNPTTTVEYEIPKQQNVTIKIFDALGREVRTLINEVKAPGKYDIIFSGDNLPSGIYFARLISGTYTRSIKMILMK